MNVLVIVAAIVSFLLALVAHLNVFYFEGIGGIIGALVAARWPATSKRGVRPATHANLAG